MGDKIHKASARMTSGLKEMDRLIEELLKACKHLESEGHSGLVSLKCALRRARRLRNQIRKKPETKIPLKETIDAINFIVSVTKLIYSILNCLKSHEAYYDNWVYYKIVKNCRRSFSDWIGPKYSCIEVILVTS